MFKMTKNIFFFFYVNRNKLNEVFIHLIVAYDIINKNDFFQVNDFLWLTRFRRFAIT